MEGQPASGAWPFVGKFTARKRLKESSLKERDVEEEKLGFRGRGRRGRNPSQGKIVRYVTTNESHRNSSRKDHRGESLRPGGEPTLIKGKV